MKTRTPALSSLFVAALGFAVFSPMPVRASTGDDASASSGRPGAPEVSRVTLEIQQGIEKHIAEKTKADGGVFKLRDGDRELGLKLVRVHREYLARLGPTRHFACVDLATPEGDVYDVDFFLEGEPDRMKVVETTVHKRNGRPYYVWKQKEDKTWVRVPFEGAPPELLGVIEGRDRFEFVYRSETPRVEESGRMWIPIPSTDRFQKVRIVEMKVPGRHRFVKDKSYGNRILVLELGPEDGGQPIEIRYDVERVETGVYDAEETDLKRYLAPERLVPLTQNFEELAQKAIRARVLRDDQEGDLARARALYDFVMDEMRYAKVGNRYGKGDAQYACDSKSGNCTDYHSYFIALARSVGIPARFAIGAAIPSSRDEGGISGYHCWAEFYADGKWWPVDISEADKCTPLSSYYFGHHPANRVELSRGRDLVVDPMPATGPINFLAYPVAEADGKPVSVPRDFSFRRHTRDS